MEKKKERNSNIEIFRIICMLMIVISHYGFYGYDLANMNFGFDRFVVAILGSFGKIGVAGFILITGYYSRNTSINYKKILLLIGQILFYTIGIFILMIIFNHDIFNAKNCLYSFFPIMSNSYWFMTNYVLLLLFSPFLNKFVLKIEKNDLKKIIIIMFIGWCILGTFKINLCYLDFNYFIFLYLLAQYIKRYVNLENINKKNINALAFLIVIGVFLLIMSVIFFTYVGYKYSINEFYLHPRPFSSLNSLLVFIIIVPLFLLFVVKKEYKNVFINKVSSHILAVYLIHENIILRTILWKKIIKLTSALFNNLIIVQGLILALTIMFICIVIDWIRKNTVEKVYIKILDKILKI